MKKRLLSCMLLATMLFSVMGDSHMAKAQEYENLIADSTEVLEDDPLAAREEGNLSEDFFGDGINAESNNLYSMYGGYAHNPRYDGMEVRDGIDVSYYQGDIDWNAVKASGIEFAIIRVGYRGYQYGTLKEDPKYLQNIQGALNAGLKVGAYIFSQAVNEAEAIEEANFVLNRIAGYNITLPIVMDFEFASGTPNQGRLFQAYASGLSREGGTAICSAFSNTVMNAGYTPMIYANKSMLQNYVDGNYLGERYKIWLANYTQQTSYAGPYSFWQYSSSGQVNGIYGRVDMNFWYDDSTMAPPAPPVNAESAARFVTLLYENVLLRAAEQSEIEYWVQELKNGRTGAEVAYLFLFSEEFKNRNYNDGDYVERLYMSLMGRGSDEGGKADWVSHLANGASREYVFKQFVDSAEFTNMCVTYEISKGSITLTEPRDQNYNVTRFVARNYTQFLGRAYEVAGLNNWCNAIVNERRTMAEIASGFVFSEECSNKNLSNEEFVKMLYRGCFDREGEEAGVREWANALDSGEKNREEVFYGFAGSREFAEMVQSYGL